MKSLQSSAVLYPACTDILIEAASHWVAMDSFRQARMRCKKYCYGDQWGDAICADGHWMREEQYIRLQGSEPLKNNLIRRLVRNVLGLYRQQGSSLRCHAHDESEQSLAQVMTTVLQCNHQLNRGDEICARSLEEFLISGLAVLRKSYGRRMGRVDCWTDMVPPDRFFFDRRATDIRGWDVDIVGQLHDLTFEALLSQFGGSSARVEALARCYASASYRERVAQFVDHESLSPRCTDFLHPSHPSLCRVIEVWRRECHPGYLCHDHTVGMLYRVADPFYPVSDDGSSALPSPLSDCCADMDVYRYSPEVWHYYFLTPFGEVLAHGATPYAHGSHPYVFKAYPFIDGEIHSFVDDVIDQQRYTNRLITLYDWVMRSSAKGVLLVPEECIPDGSCIEDIADEWARFNGVITVKTRNGTELPRQMAANSVNIGINELLQTQLQLMEDISGVTPALQGRADRGNSGTLYEQQTRNARLSQLDLLDTFNSFLVDGGYKDMHNIQQFYDTRRVVRIVGDNAAQVVYDPARMGDLEFDLTLSRQS